MVFQKESDRIFITKHVRDFITKKLDKNNYFGLSHASATRSELFLFAVALGVETGMKTPLDSTDGGLARETSIDFRMDALMKALLISHLESNEIDSVAKKSNVYRLSQEYANTGFKILEGYFKSTSDDDLVWNLLDQLDEQYDKLILSGEFNK